MPNKELPSIVCPHCYIKQTYRPPDEHASYHCTSCGKRISDWKIATQLLHRKEE